MHGTFSFLIDLEAELLEDNDHDELKSTVEDLFDSRFGNDRCDENNWYQHEALILPNGDVVQMCPEGDFRGREEMAKHIKAKWGTGTEVWDRAMTFAARCIAMDMGLLGSNSFSLPGMEQTTPDQLINSMGYNQLIDAIYEHIPKELARRYSKYKRPESGAKFDFEDYQRTKLARAFEAFHSGDVPPFATDSVSPYDYRAFDLRWDVGGTDTDGCVVLLTDIHT
jgi:hypothetical protein